MAVETSPQDGAPRAAPLDFDPSTLTHAYRRQTAVEVPDVAAERRSMPPITRSNMAARRDLQRLIRADAECGRQRPPTPARPSLPQLDTSVRGRAGSPTRRGSRSRSEPRPTGQQEEDDFDQVTDLLDCSVRSDGGGWRSIRARGLMTSTGDESPSAASAGVTLPPIGSSGKQTPVQRMNRQETQKLLAQAKVNLQAMETV
ncbi:hypothetical protein FJT64_001906 [Amphibalanus amphitrite]|uniref:Uncharacterized protein n=1 Tax=Amphibalanus amphitrite TaxID=1232801 RepID=A0A6A4X6W7_AMPAM|nr:uncharacterized protein LOC122374402 [Amphibalanus amphitrite]KAF0310708.1 hypothetical protein FJT64_001906 [Amphibalanus amphitrite]